MNKLLVTIFTCLMLALSFTATASNTTASSFVACPLAAPSSASNFCATFTTSAVCNCRANGLSGPTCADPHRLYQYLMDTLHSLNAICLFQHQVSYQVCADQWNCYMNGGRDSTGGLCNSTGSKC